MSDVSLISNSTLESISDAIKEKTGATGKIPPQDMPASIRGIKPVLQNKTVTENGVVSADDGYDGLGEVTVAVASSGGGISVDITGKSIEDNVFADNTLNVNIRPTVEIMSTFSTEEVTS